jgi:4-hydroxy-2-oxoheptanedioate aldolase
MQHPDTFRDRVLSGEWLAGVWLNLGSSLTAELAGRTGFDWVLIDQEHGAGSEMTLLHQLQAVAATAAIPIVRVAANEAPRFKRTLDLGARGIMVPYVSSEAEARAAVANLRYPPRGIRGVAKFNRAADFGTGFADYYAHAHERLITAVQIETREAMDAIDAIARVDGVDVLFVGPMDLSTNLGVQEQWDAPVFATARQRVPAAARAAGKAAGILLSNPAHVPVVRAEGYTFVALGSDGSLAAAGLRQTLTSLRSP